MSTAPRSAKCSTPTSRPTSGRAGYVLDDEGKLRKHMAAFIDGRQIDDRDRLSDAVPDGAVVDIVQSLSGG